MVSWKKKDSTIRPPSAAQKPEKTSPPDFGRCRLIEQITCAKNRIHGVAFSQIEESIDRLDASTGQLSLVLFGKGGDASAKMPIRCVQNLKGHVLFLHHPHTRSKSTSRIRMVSGGR